MMDKLNEVDHFVGDDVLLYAQGILNNAKNQGCRQMFDELNVKDCQIVNVDVKQDVYDI